MTRPAILPKDARLRCAIARSTTGKTLIGVCLVLLASCDADVPGNTSSPESEVRGASPAGKAGDGSGTPSVAGPIARNIAPCDEKDEALYSESKAAVVQYLARTMPQPDTRELSRIAMSYTDRMSASCLSIIQAVAAEQQTQPQAVPDWAKRPWLPNECHAGVCAPPD